MTVSFVEKTSRCRLIARNVFCSGNYNYLTNVGTEIHRVESDRDDTALRYIGKTEKILEKLFTKTSAVFKREYIINNHLSTLQSDLLVCISG